MFKINILNKINYLEEKKRFLLIMIFFLLVLFLSFYLFEKAYSSYNTKAKLNANIERALYIFNQEKMDFNIDFNKIVPSDEPYIYKFSISNFNNIKTSDVDLNYAFTIRTTTNLPITLELYRNQNYDDNNAVNIINKKDTKQDIDNTWYNVYGPTEEFLMKHSEKTTDIYTLVVNFPLVYANNTTYADSIEYIGVEVESKQVIE